MESHILNMYHQGPYRSIEGNSLRTSESVSSESSHQTSPEHSQGQQTAECESDEEYWEEDEQSEQRENEDGYIPDSYQDTSLDEDEYIQVDDPTRPVHVIQVYVINPENEADVDDEGQDCPDVNDTDDYTVQDVDSVNNVNEEQAPDHNLLPHTVIDDSTHSSIDLVTNVNDFFVLKDNDEKDILKVRDEPVVKDVDEYFIKNPQDTKTVVSDFIVKNESEVIDFRIPNSKKEFLENDNESKVQETTEVQEEQIDPNISINESDLEGLPNIEDLKRYILDETPCPKFKNSHKSCSVSLPHSPIHNICLDIDAKTCLSFEDLNLDLSDLALDSKFKLGNNKSDEIPHSLTEEDVNSFLITNNDNQREEIVNGEDDHSQQDMELEQPVNGSIIDSVDFRSFNASISHRKSSTPVSVSQSLLDSEKNETKAPKIKAEVDDFVDVESCNEVAIPVLKANNVKSLLEQFEATEKLNNDTKTRIIEKEVQAQKVSSRMRLQDAGIKLNKTKMSQILMPATIKTTIKAPSPDYSDHNYCSKKRQSHGSLKSGQSLLKPEVLSSNNRILNSRHRSCKDKKVNYYPSSDEEGEKEIKKNKLLNNHVPSVNKTLSASDKLKKSIKTEQLTHSSVTKKNCCKGKESVIVKNSSKVCDMVDNPKPNYSGSIKLTIKNKSEVIINDCKLNPNLVCDTSDGAESVSVISENEGDKKTIYSDSNAIKKEPNWSEEKCIVNVDIDVKPDVNRLNEEINSNPGDFYTGLFNEKDVYLPQSLDVKSEGKPKENEVKTVNDALNTNSSDQQPKKRKLNLLEYKLRRGASSNNSSAQVSPEAIFPDLPSNINLEKTFKTTIIESGDSVPTKIDQSTTETPKKVFDPILEASRKIIMISKKQKAEALRKRDEDIVMSKIPKVENLELQPLMSDTEMMKIVGMAPEVVPVPIPIVAEKISSTKDYDEIMVVSIGTNTEKNLLLKCSENVELKKKKCSSPLKDKKNTINFKIKKSEHVLKQNIFDSVNKHNQEGNIIKIDNERFKDITATLKSVERQVDTKISSNSLFASIQDVVMKKAPVTKTHRERNSSKSISPVEKHSFKFKSTMIIRAYDNNSEHGEDKVILHLDKNRGKPECTSVLIQTDPITVSTHSPENKPVEQTVIQRKRNDSDMSVSSGDSPCSSKKIEPQMKHEAKISPKPKTDTRPERRRSRSKDKKSRSKDRYDLKYRRSRSRSRHGKRRSRSRIRSRSRGRYPRYRRGASPYKRRRRSRTRSPYRRRSPSMRREHRTKRSRTRSRSRHNDRKKSRSPIVTKKSSPKYAATEKKTPTPVTPPIRKTSVSEASETSSSSSSSSSTSSSGSEKSRRSSSSFRRDEAYRNKVTRSFSSEDRESNTPVEERRIVFVGKLEKDLTKAALRGKFSKFGPVTEVRLHSKEDGSRYGFVTFQRPRDAWSAVEAANTFPQYDVGFGGRRAFCRQSYADLDGLEAKYTESAFHGTPAPPARRANDMSFEQMLLDMKNKLSKRKVERTHDSTA